MFRAVFPIALSESPEEAIEPWKSTTAAPSLTSLQNARSANPEDDARPSVLVVEDNLDLQAYIRVVLEEKYQITTAGNGKEALRCLEKMANCKLILSDLMMPVMDGYQFLEKLKSGDATRHIPVIMFSARAEARDKLKALRIGVDDYLTKPFDEEELLEMRLDKARQVLEENSGSSLAKIASEAGYSDIRTFSRSFRQRFGKLPSELLGK